MRRGLSASSGRGTGEGIGTLLRIVRFTPSEQEVIGPSHAPDWS